jgi:hypothetical protein
MAYTVVVIREDEDVIQLASFLASPCAPLLILQYVTFYLVVTVILIRLVPCCACAYLLRP